MQQKLDSPQRHVVRCCRWQASDTIGQLWWRHQRRRGQRCDKQLVLGWVLAGAERVSMACRWQLATLAMSSVNSINSSQQLPTNCHPQSSSNLVWR